MAVGPQRYTETVLPAKQVEADKAASFTVPDLKVHDNQQFYIAPGDYWASFHQAEHNGESRNDPVGDAIVVISQTRPVPGDAA